MNFPKANYVVDKKGQKLFVQLSVSEWEDFLKEVKQLKAETELKRQLKNAFEEVGQIQKGEKKATTLKDFLNEI